MIELLVVIAIIAILAAILFPVFAKAREKARQVNCVSNLKQVALALQQYVQDYDETLPRYSNGTVMTGGGPQIQTFARVLMPYVKNGQMWVCPSRRETNWLAFDDPDQVWAPPAYGVNDDYLFPGTGYGVVSLSMIDEPAGTIAAGERYQLNTAVLYSPSGGGSTSNPPCNVDTRHNDGANFMFMDGHVKYLPKSGSWRTDDTLWDRQ